MSPYVRLASILGVGLVAIAWPLIDRHEGNIPRGYKDPIGITTACRGHTQFAQLGRTYTEQQCDELFAADLWAHNAEMLECVKVPLNVNEHAAYLSFTFNVGTSKFCASTMARKLNAGDRAGACAELSRWILAGNRELPGLVKRRSAERTLCETQP